MTTGSQPPTALPLDAWGAFRRAAPTALTLIPICLLLGVLAAKTNWSLLEMLLFSALGFSGSGQFALLPLAEQGFGVFTMLVVAVSINIRYVPIALTTVSRLPREPLPRAFTAHLLGDEAYALEHECDTFAAVLVTRLTIYLTWVTATVAGVLIASLIPGTWFGPGINLGFPASVVLLVLCFGQIKARVPRIAAPWRRRLLELALCVAVALLLLTTLGKTWFWLPSIAFSVWRLWKAGA